MESVRNQKGRRAAFTIVELLTVMSIIVILMGLVLPALNMVRKYALTVKQNGQFGSIQIALNLYHGDFESYPPSNLTTNPRDYGGAQKLAEALMGQDLLGFHPKSRFTSDGLDSAGNDLYPDPLNLTNPAHQANVRLRKGPYLDLSVGNAYDMASVYGLGNCGSFDPNSFVICDVYSTTNNRGDTGKPRIGLPVLYYRADVSKLEHDPNSLPAVNNTTHTYDYQDNDELVRLGAPFNSVPAADDHPFSGANGTPSAFYMMTRDRRIVTVNQSRAQRADSYILVSAGIDGLYGTEDDIYNFEK